MCITAVVHVQSVKNYCQSNTVSARLLWSTIAHALPTTRLLVFSTTPRQCQPSSATLFSLSATSSMKTTRMANNLARMILEACAPPTTLPPPPIRAARLQPLPPPQLLPSPPPRPLKLLRLLHPTRAASLLPLLSPSMLPLVLPLEPCLPFFKMGNHACDSIELRGGLV